MDWALWPRKGWAIDISRLTAASLRDLKRFSCCGGLNLADLRNLSRLTAYGMNKYLREVVSVSRASTSVLQNHEVHEGSQIQRSGLEQV